MVCRVSSSVRESPYDAFGAGHAATAISAALGMAVARDLKGEQFKVIAVLGDGALTCGLAYEGLNNAGASDRDIVVVLNDNEMSIAPNVGAMSKYLTSVQRNPLYNRVRSAIGAVIEQCPGSALGDGDARPEVGGEREVLLHTGCPLRGAGIPLLRPHQRP